MIHYQSIFSAYTANHVKDVIELAKILSNPLWLKKILPPFSLLKTNQQQDRDTYEKRVVDFINENFNFSGKESLKKIAIDFFIKIYDKVSNFLMICLSLNLSLRDCNGGDIFGNSDVCTYCSTFELFRREPGNRPFVAVGDTFNSEKIENISNKINKDSGLHLGVVPYRRFNEQGTCIYNSSEERAKITQQCEQKKQKLDKMKNNLIQINNNIIKYKQKIHNTSDMDIENKLVKKTNKLVVRYNEGYKQYDKALKQYNHDINFHRLPISVDLIPTNDLSSRVRVQTSYLVFVININHSIKNSPFLQESAKTTLPVEKNTMLDLNHFTQSIGYKSIGNIVLASEDLTPLKVLILTNCKKKIDIIFAATGMAFVSFNAENEGYQSIEFPKRFLNRTTTNFAEKGFVDLRLGCFHIFDPFSTVIGKGGFNDHARLIEQY
jgi:hypothetical protein